MVRKASVRLERGESGIILTVEDMGAGFDWTGFMKLDVARPNDPHGRGIAMSRLISFSEVTYEGRGNKVVCGVDV